jgi:hypothetical protein
MTYEEAMSNIIISAYEAKQEIEKHQLDKARMQRQSTERRPITRCLADYQYLCE